MGPIESVSSSITRGMSLAAQSNWGEAAEVFRRAMIHDPEAFEPRYRLGWALWKRAETEKPTFADLGVGYAAHVFGFDSLAKQRGGKFARHKKLLQDAAHWLREAIAREPESADAHFFLAQVLKELGYQDEAVAIAKKANTLQPSNLKYASLLRSYKADEQLEPFEHSRAEDDIRLKWADLILNSKTKRELRQIQIMMERPDAARELGVDPPSGILLKGAPGTGKTTIARVLASESKCKFFTISPADINQMYVGVSEQRVKELFERARSHAPSIIFVDEIDALLPSRQGGVAIHSDKVVNQFLQEMDGMTPNLRVLVVGATNRVDMLDPAVRRGGRLSREIEIPLPDETARLSLLELFTRTVKLDEAISLTEIAIKTTGWSGADLKALVNEAGLQALIRITDSEDESEGKRLAQRDFTEAFDALNETS